MIEAKDLQSDCFEVTHAPEQGEAGLRDLIINRGGKSYRITVATTGYLSKLEIYNQGFPNGLQIDTNAYIVDELPGIKELCQSLSAIPFKDLEPYLTEQTALS